MTESQIVKSLRAQGAHDGRAASSRIDRVESMVRRMAATVVKTVGPDQVLRNAGSREEALAVLEAAGLDTGPIVARWNAEQAAREAAVPKQVTTHFDSERNDPRHDPRVVDAIMRGASDAELRQITKQVVAEYRHRITREAAQASHRRNYMWTDARTGRPVYGDQVPVPLGASTDPHTGTPVQKTLSTNTAVPELGSEPVPAPDMSDVRVMATACTEHAGQPGDRYCSVCGRPRP